MWLPLHRPRALFLLFLLLREPSQECYATAGPRSLKLPQLLGLGGAPGLDPAGHAQMVAMTT